jgi:NADH dehydrogenase FAD-containing subunit
MKRSAYFALFLSGISNDAESFQPSSSHLARRTALNAAAANGDSSGGGKKRVVVIGNGMVGQRFMENLIDLDKDKTCTISTFCEEPRAAYNRVKLTSYFETRDPSALSMTSDFDEYGRTPWYEENNVELLLNDKAVSIDTQSKTIVGASGKTLDYDVAVFATGSFPFVPPIPGRQRPGVFVYRVSGRSSVRHTSLFFHDLHSIHRAHVA